MTPRRLALVTGCAGFIGSHLSERLVADGWRVVGVDAFKDFYPRAEKEANIAALRTERCFDLVEADLCTTELAPLVAGRTAVFHLAAQAGIRRSFGDDGRSVYARDNVLATRRVFDAAFAAGVERVIWASSSSVYGDARSYPCREDSTPTAPRSPYGVTKRACEKVARLYRDRGLEVVALRYFTVYGARQRPDMAIRRLCEALVGGGRFSLYGDGSQSRDFTYVDDAVEATCLAAEAPYPPPVLNVGGGSETTLAAVIAKLQALAGVAVALEPKPAQKGDMARTAADTSLALATIGWRPRVRLREGLRQELDWVGRRSAARSEAA